MSKVASKVDALLDEAVVAKCRHGVHRLPDDGLELMRRARQRSEAGENISAAGLERILKREFGVPVTGASIRNYLRSGCSCDE